MPCSMSLPSSILVVLPLILFWIIPDARALALTPPGDPLPIGPGPTSALGYLDRTLVGLRKAMNFFRREHQHVNLDAVIGTRIVQATFTVLIRNMDKRGTTQKIPTGILAEIRRLREAALEVSQMSTPYVVATEPNYFKKIGPIINDGLFSLDYPSRELPNDTSTVWPKKQKEAMREEESDACLAELFLTRFGFDCSISYNCWKLMTSFGYSQYSLSHQIFYLEIAQQLGCSEEMARHLSPTVHTVDSLQDIFCANMLAESRDIAAKGFPARSQDLFMEQAALCGMLGYREFFTPEWLDKVLSWQDATNGCYRWAAWPMKEHEPHESVRLLQKVLAKIRPDPIRPGKSYTFRSRRTKREEKRVGHGCLCHRTTVAASALAQYARFVLEDYLKMCNGEEFTSPAHTGTESTSGPRRIRSTRYGHTLLEQQAVSLSSVSTPQKAGYTSQNAGSSSLKTRSPSPRSTSQKAGPPSENFFD